MARWSQGVRDGLLGVATAAVSLIAVTLFLFAMLFADSEADEIPMGVVQTVVWFTFAGGALVSLTAMQIMLVRSRRRQAIALFALTAGLDVGFWAYAGFLTG